MKTIFELLYRKISTAREHCCGEAPKKKKYLLMEVERAIDFAREADVPMVIRNKLLEARRIIVQSKTYVERLPADNLLCSILNNELAGCG